MEMKEIPANATGNASRAHPKKYYTLGADQSVIADFDPDYNGEAKLLAYLGSTDSSASKKIADSIALEFDGSETEIDDVTFADAGFGQGEGRTYYAPVTLATVDVIKGNTEVIITGIANNLNIGAIALIPVDKIADEEPVNPVDPTPLPSKKGCGSSIALTTSLISILGLGAFTYLTIKGRKED